MYTYYIVVSLWETISLCVRSLNVNSSELTEHHTMFNCSHPSGTLEPTKAVGYISDTTKIFLTWIMQKHLDINKNFRPRLHV